MKNTYLICIFIFGALSALCQQIDNEILIGGLKSRSEVLQLCAGLRNQSTIEVKSLSDDFPIYGVYFGEPIDESTLAFLRRQKGVEYAVYNVYADHRLKPNDAQYLKQWSIEHSKIHKVWDVTTGGKLYDGREIVVAVLDDGMDISHEDINANIFVNAFEVAGDGIDNDGNGYTDDYQGYNVNDNNGSPITMAHGTGVIGLIGAVGNNQIGIAGVNWNIKILPIFGVNKLDEIIQAYSYILKMKRAYNNSNGTKGALVVATNYSGGISKAFGNVEPYRSWCEQYQLLGLEGVLNVGATDNENIDVSVVGDMPTTCTSEFFIGTTNLEESGKKVIRAAYSNEYVALAAPGELLTTLRPGNKYENAFSGTSAATPMVAGTIALLYSIPCSSFANLMTLDKVQAARLVRDAIKDGVTKTSELTSLTKWGGYLDAEKSLGFLADACDGQLVVDSPKGPLEIRHTYYIGEDLFINYLTPEEDNIYTVSICDVLGREFYRQVISVPAYGKKETVVPYFLKHQGLFIVNIFDEKNIASRLFYSGI